MVNRLFGFETYCFSAVSSAVMNKQGCGGRGRRISSTYPAYSSRQIEEVEEQEEEDGEEEELSPRWVDGMM